MQAAVSVSFLSPEFNEFLYAPIGGESNGMPLSVLSALARLNIDPWSEAAALSALPRKGATQRMAALIERLPGRRWTQDEREVIAERLTKLLPQRSQSDPSVQNANSDKPWVVRGRAAKQLMLAAIAVVFLILAASGGLSVRGDHLDSSTIGTGSPSPPPPASR